MLNDSAHISYVVHSMESGRNLKLRSAGPMARLPYSACWEPEQAASVVVWDGTGNLLTSFVFYKGMFHSKVAIKLTRPCLPGASMPFFKGSQRGESICRCMQLHKKQVLSPRLPLRCLQ